MNQVTHHWRAPAGSGGPGPAFTRAMRQGLYRKASRLLRRWLAGRLAGADPPRFSL